ncbi:unnamed protein product [Rangifer tarandus platyrhynchus]|uniref:Uncharacterized protein n=1 Tax=Rangifer tarandus platyrhynchus TaxID=3082113 RepID=A0ABN8YR64_RANTA|nr:unnamed protein product [Rangifer tarandus platyrhynchus]
MLKGEDQKEGGCRPPPPAAIALSDKKSEARDPPGTQESEGEEVGAVDGKRESSLCVGRSTGDRSLCEFLPF